MTGMPAKPRVYIELCRQTSSSVSLNILVLRDSFTFTSLGGFSCSFQGCITQQSCLSMGRTRLRDEPVPFIAVSFSIRLCFGSLTARCEWPGVQFNTPCQNEHVCLVLLLEAQILGFGTYQAFPVGKCCFHSIQNIFVVKLLVQNTSLTDVKRFAVCRAKVGWIHSFVWKKMLAGQRAAASQTGVLQSFHDLQLQFGTGYVKCIGHMKLHLALPVH